ncbi:hypothetical protein ANO14919_145790 [Xylariales sp. No.14919]|nr:hypothetical protein ANO14919_145790 [Xylariales sp. No.14919]
MTFNGFDRWIARQRVLRQWVLRQRMTGLHLAAYFGLDKVTTIMLGYYNADVRDRNGNTPLPWAARNEHEAVVGLLLNAPEINPNSRNDIGNTPLLWAAINGHEAVVGLLLNAPEINPNLMDNRGDMPLPLAARKHETVARLLNAKGVSPDSRDRRGRTSLWWAILHKHEAVAGLLLSTGRVNPNPKDYDGLTPEMYRWGQGRRGQDRRGRSRFPYSWEAIRDRNLDIIGLGARFGGQRETSW